MGGMKVLMILAITLRSQIPSNDRFKSLGMRASLLLIDWTVDTDLL
jgi:hypothetical protein